MHGFNHDFYVTVATVVPLLYITIFLQSRSVEGLAAKVGIPFIKGFAADMERIESRPGEGRYDVFYMRVTVMACTFALLVLATVNPIVMVFRGFFFLAFTQDDTAEEGEPGDRTRAADD